jgi:hypothetical protein
MLCQRELEALDSDVLTFCKVMDRLLQAHLLLADYPQHHRSERRNVMARFALTSAELLQLVRWTVELNNRLPKKYRNRMSRLINVFREVMYTRKITLPASQLAMYWQCAVADLPRDLYLLTRGSKGAVTYRLESGRPGLGLTVELSFTVTEGGRQYDTSCHRDGATDCA